MFTWWVLGYICLVRNILQEASLAQLPGECFTPPPATTKKIRWTSHVDQAKISR